MECSFEKRTNMEIFIFSLQMLRNCLWIIICCTIYFVCFVPRSINHYFCNKLTITKIRLKRQFRFETILQIKFYQKQHIRQQHSTIHLAFCMCRNTKYCVWITLQELKEIELNFVCLKFVRAFVFILRTTHQTNSAPGTVNKTHLMLLCTTTIASTVFPVRTISSQLHCVWMCACRVQCFAVFIANNTNATCIELRKTLCKTWDKHTFAATGASEIAGCWYRLLKSKSPSNTQ